MIHGSGQCGAVQWRFEGMPESATACNCTACRRYGALWAYDFESDGMCQVRPNPTHAGSGSFFISAFHAGALRIGAACTSTERAGVRWGSICE